MNIGEPKTRARDRADRRAGPRDPARRGADGGPGAGGSAGIDMRRDGLLSMVALLVLSGCTTAAAGSTVVPTPTVGVTPSSVDAQRGPGGSAVVTRTVDGDTIHVTFHGQDLDVRLIGIDTPETVDPSQPVQCFGEQASRFTTGDSPARPFGWSSTWSGTIGTGARSRTCGWTDDCSTGGS